MTETLTIWLRDEAHPHVYYEPRAPGGTKTSWISVGPVTLAVVIQHEPRTVEIFPLTGIRKYEHAT